jgi:hypothetical protein
VRILRYYPLDQIIEGVHTDAVAGKQTHVPGQKRTDGDGDEGSRSQDQY